MQHHPIHVGSRRHRSHPTQRTRDTEDISRTVSFALGACVFRTGTRWQHHSRRNPRGLVSSTLQCCYRFIEHAWHQFQSKPTPLITPSGSSPTTTTTTTTAILTSASSHTMNTSLSTWLTNPSHTPTPAGIQPGSSQSSGCQHQLAHQHYYTHATSSSLEHQRPRLSWHPTSTPLRPSATCPRHRILHFPFNRCNCCRR